MQFSKYVKASEKLLSLSNRRTMSVHPFVYRTFPIYTFLCLPFVCLFIIFFDSLNLSVRDFDIYFISFSHDFVLLIMADGLFAVCFSVRQSTRLSVCTPRARITQMHLTQLWEKNVLIRALGAKFGTSLTWQEISAENDIGFFSLL